MLIYLVAAIGAALVIIDNMATKEEKVKEETAA